MVELIESEEAAKRLGIKLPTLYSYVSRGLLPSHRGTDGRKRLFDEKDIAHLAQRGRSGGGRRHQQTVVSAITEVSDAGPVYRGTPAVELAVNSSFEEIAQLLWGIGSADGFDARACAPPSDLDPHDLIRWVVVMNGAADPLRSDLRPEAVTRAAKRLIATLIVTLPPAGDRHSPEAGLVSRLTAHLTLNSSDAAVAAVNTAMVVLANHGLSSSTLAVRVAASSRVSYYDAILAGLGTFVGPATEIVHSLIRSAVVDGPERAIDGVLRNRGSLPGFGHPLYPEGDPRVPPLLSSFEAFASDNQRCVVSDLLAAVDLYGFPKPNVDFATGAIMYAGDMPSNAGNTIFTISRIVGWTAHFLEELAEPPSRFRTRPVLREPDQARPERH